jgi:hypothetical protein
MTLTELEQRRAAIPDVDALPASSTRTELRTIQDGRRDLDRRLRQARDAQVVLDELVDDRDPAWRDQLEAWRKICADELLALPPRVRDPRVLGTRINLTVSIRCIDHGPDHALDGQPYSLPTTRLGELMIVSGYQVVGADPDRNFGGTLPWHGSLKEVEHRIKDRERRQAAARAALDDALLDDDVRAVREAETKELRDAYNALRVKNSGDPNAPGLRVVDGNGDDVNESTLTTLQQRALALAREALLAVTT